jgi:hypothetical protein
MTLGVVPAHLVNAQFVVADQATDGLWRTMLVAPATPDLALLATALVTPEYGHRSASRSQARNCIDNMRVTR